MSPDATMPAAIDRVTESMFRNRLSVNVRLTVSMLAAGVYPALLPTFQTGCQFRHSAMRCYLRPTRVKSVCARPR